MNKRVTERLWPKRYLILHMNKRCKKPFRFATVCAILIGLVCLQNLKRHTNMDCKEDFQTGEVLCRPKCAKGYFSLPGMKRCHPWLKCDAIKNQLTLLNTSVGHGHMKTIAKARWNDHTVILNTCEKKRIKKMYPSVLEHLRDLQPSKYVVQLIGYCGFTYVTEFHPLDSAVNYEQLLQSPSLQKRNNIRTRLETCVSYIEVVHHMHNSPICTRILQDTHHLDKCLSQFLLTPDLKVVLNDIDYLPEADREAGLTAKDWGKLVTFNPFISPERFNRTDYDEKADIWIIPSVCEFFLGSDLTHLRNQLSVINVRCKKQNPSQRPTAAEVLDFYRGVLVNAG